jgi:hypothetical protein
MRIELIGLSMPPQHSDAHVFDQIINKWRHSRRVIGKVLAEKYCDMAEAGWTPDKGEIERDAQNLSGGALDRFCGRQAWPGSGLSKLGSHMDLAAKGNWIETVLWLGVSLIMLGLAFGERDTGKPPVRFD